MTDRTGRGIGGRYCEEGTRTGGDAEVPFRWSCQHCETELKTETVEAMRDRGTAHLETHAGVLRGVFADKDRGTRCQNECGHVFSAGDDETAGFECPECGHENFEEFAHRYLYWQIEYS